MTNEIPAPMRIMQMMFGHQLAQTLAVVAELGIPDALAAGPQTSAQLAAKVGADAAALHRLVRTAAAFGVIKQLTPDSFENNDMSDCLRSDSPTSMRDLMVAQMAPGHWLPWGRLLDVVRSGKQQASAALGRSVWEYYASHPEEAAWFARGMSNLSQMVARDVVAAFDFSPYTRIADVGGSQGALLAAILHATLTAHGVLFDRPEVIAEGQTSVAAYGLGQRLTTKGGDFFNHVPTECDAYLLKSILHDWDDEHCVSILKAVHRGAPTGAKVFVFEMLLSDAPEAARVKLMDMNMMVLLDGRERTTEEYAALFQASGFHFDGVTPTHGPFQIIAATKR